MEIKDKTVILKSFFDTYSTVIDNKLDNGDYTIMYNDGITIKINDKVDIILYPQLYIWNNEVRHQLVITIVRYNIPIDYNRKYNICGTYRLISESDKNEYNLYSLYYDKCNEIYSTLNVPKFYNILIDIATDIRAEKIERLL